MVERDDDHFDLDDDFVAESDEEQSYENFIDTADVARVPARRLPRRRARRRGASSKTCWPTVACRKN